MRRYFRKFFCLVLSLAMLASIFVMPTHAINSLMDIPVKKGCYMTLETNKHAVSYMPGDEVVMTVRLFDASGKQISAPYIRYNLRVDGSNEAGYGEYQLYWTTVPFKDGEYTIKTRAIDIPGFMRLRVDILDENKTVITGKYTTDGADWTGFGPSGQLSFFQGGIVVDAENIRTTAATREGKQVGAFTGVTYNGYGVPSDFMDFWQDALSELDEKGNSPKLIELSQVPVETYNNWYRYNHDLYEFKVSCPGDSTDLVSGDTFVTGIIQIPTDVALASAPIEMYYCGYGISNPQPQGSNNIKGKIAITVAAHSLDYDFVNRVAHTDADFNLHADQQGATNYYGFSFTENQNRDEIYFKYMLLRDVQMVRFATNAFRQGGQIEFDASADAATKSLAAKKLVAGLWDGENIKTSGSSQGGFQAVAVAALYSEIIGGEEQRITELYAGIPWMCDVQGNTNSLKVQSTYRQDYLKNGIEAVGLNYYDTVNFGYFIKCDTVISAGMGDPLCPASGVTALYNNICASSTDINVTLGYTQGRTHSINDNSAQHTEEKIYRYKPQEPTAGYTDPDSNFAAWVDDGVLSIYSLGDDKILTGTSGDAFVSYLAPYKTKINTVKIIGKFAEIGDTQYMFTDLDSVTTMLIDYRTSTIGAYNTSTYAGNFIGMAKLSSLGHVEFDPAGNVVASSRYNTYEEGVCDLRGFDFVVNHTGKSDFNMLPPCVLRATGVKKVIMPDSLMCGGVDVAGILPKNALALCYSLTEVVVPESVEVSVLGSFFVWNDKAIKAIRFEGGVTDDFKINGKATDAYPTNDGVVGATIYCPTMADANIVSTALGLAEISVESICAAVAENDGFAIKNGVLTVYHNGDSGIAKCDAVWLSAMDGVREIVIENGYSYLGANIFQMISVDRITIPESVKEISSDCFGGATDFTIVGAVGSYAQTFAQENGIKFAYEAALINAITADGFSVRIEGHTGIRGLFTFSDETKAENNAAGYTLVEYGALACSGIKYRQYGYDAETIFRASATDKYLVKVVVEGEGGRNTFVDPDKKQFCVSIVNFASANYTSGLYMCGYQIWSDGEREYFLASEYVPQSGEKNYTVNLYELTLFGFKNGIVNSETMEDVCLWNVLETQAVTLSNFNSQPYVYSSTEYAVTAKNGYTTANNGSFTFKNIPLLKYTGSANGNIGWNFAPTGLEKTSTSGIVWSLIPDGENYVAVFRAAKGATSDTVLMPRQTNDEHAGYYFAHLPIHESWGCLTSATDGEYLINSPRLCAEDVAKIKTLILDYGIDGHEGAGLASLSSIETVVYPNGYTSVESYCFNGSRSLKNIIWANDGQPHMSDVEGIPEDEGLADLRGMKGIKTSRYFYNCSSIKNVVFDSFDADEARMFGLFMGMTALSRAWMSNGKGGTESAPAANVIDMRGATEVTKLESGVFEMGSTPRTIYLPVTITTIAESTGYGHNMAFGKGYAHKIYTESADFKAVLSAYYTHVTTKFSGTNATVLDKLIINDLPIAEYLTN